MSTNQNNLSKHNFFMGLALKQAQNYVGNTGVNPSVGCVITKNNFIISASSTSISGRPHAEQNAIGLSKYPLFNSEIYLTLEPCSHIKNNSSCTKLIIKKKIKKVYFSINDPDVRSFNKCSYQFTKNKILVSKGLSHTLAKTFYKDYFKNKIHDFPHVSAKIAVSKDLYTKNIKKKWITNIYSRQRVHLIRSKFDCILTSHKTVGDDNPYLTCRIQGLENRSPCRVILDKNLKVPIDSNILKISKNHKTIIFFNKFSKKKIKLLKKLKVKLIQFPIAKNGDFDLYQVLYKIKLLGYSRILLESGMRLTSNFVSKNLVDDFMLFVSNKKLGINGRGKMKEDLKLLLKKRKFHHEKINLFGDKLLIYRLK